MISEKAAQDFARQNFPLGPERLAERLGIEVIYSSLQGCDGWCLAATQGIVIRINNYRITPARQRFTLAHELGHLVLGVPTVVGETVYDSLRSDSDEERRVNKFAAELLLPEEIVRQLVPGVPVVAANLEKLAHKAHVSQLAAAIRVANLAESIGLVNASVLFFEEGTFAWQWSKTLRITRPTAERLLVQAKACKPAPARTQRSDGKVVVASLIENPFFASATVFVQLLPEEQGNQLSQHEQRQHLEAYLFKGLDPFRRQLQGCFGAFKPAALEMSLDEAVAAFFERYEDRWEGTAQRRFLSSHGRQYVRLRIAEWLR